MLTIFLVDKVDNVDNFDQKHEQPGTSWQCWQFRSKAWTTRNAGRRRDWEQLTLVSTLSPCIMCTGASLLYKIKRSTLLFLPRCLSSRSSLKLRGPSMPSISPNSKKLGKIISNSFQSHQCKIPNKMGSMSAIILNTNKWYQIILNDIQGGGGGKHQLLFLCRGCNGLSGG